MNTLAHAPHGWLLLGLSHVNDVLITVVTEASVLGPPEAITILGAQLPPSRPIGLASGTERFRVSFPMVVAYRVLPENSRPPEAAGEPPGNPCLYDRSEFLAQMCAVTHIELLHGPGLLHYALFTEHFVVDVLCKGSPLVESEGNAGV